MSKKCGHSVPCGCGDNALTTPPPCNTTGDCEGELCAEVFCESCITNCNEEYNVDFGAGNILTVPKGQRLDVTIQKLYALIGSPACLALTATGLTVTNITSTTAVVNWIPVIGVSYDIYINGINTITLPIDLTSYSMIGLLPNTSYTVNIKSGACSSIILNFKTKPA
jgi:hypothetical protein